MRTGETWLLFAHILSAIIWLGGGLMLYVLAERARRIGEPGTVVAYARTLAYVGPRVLGPSSGATLVFGLWLVLQSDTWGFAQWWVRIGVALFAIAFLIGAAWLGRIGVRLQRATENAEASVHATFLLGRWVFGYRLILLVLLLAVWDMVFKPGL